MAKKKKAPKKPQFILKMESDDKARQKDWENQYNTSKGRKMAGAAIAAYKEDCHASTDYRQRLKGGVLHRGREGG